MTIDTVIHARWVVPVQPAGEVYDNHAIAIHENRIVEVLPSSKATEKYQATEEIHLPNHVLIPGLINAHTHAAMSLFRGLADDLPLMDWLENHIWPAETRWVNPEFVRDGTRLAIAEMLRSGTTCFNDMYFFPDQCAQVSHEIGMRACVGLIVIDFPTAWAANPEEYFNKGLAVHDSYRSNPLIHTAFAPHAPYTVSDEPLTHIATLVEELDIPIHMHLHETASEVTMAFEANAMRPLQRMQALGILGPRLMAVHMTQLAAEEIEQLVQYGVSVVHCPESNMKLASGTCPVHQLQKAGINVALGTDGAASNNDLDMFAEMRSAALLGKLVAGDSCAVPAHVALQMATLNGARALGLEAITGSLEAGKSADLTAVDLSSLETQPVYDPISQLVYAAGREHVSDVWVAGRQLLKDRRLVTIDEQELLARAHSWQSRICEE